MAGWIEKGRLLQHDLVGPQMFRMVLYMPQTANAIQPGQFIHLRVTEDWDPFLRRPFSVSDADTKKGTIEVIYRVVGRGTELLSNLQVGVEMDSLGPLGTIFTLDNAAMLAVGGGVGIAPLLFLARRASAQSLTVVIGGRNKEEVFWKDMFPSTLKELIVTTDDGSEGAKGFVISVLPNLLDSGEFSLVVTCGPTIMMKKTAEIAADYNVACEVSLERRMGCGTGGCLSCVCDKTGGGHLKVCTDGPVFSSKEVIL